MHPLRIIQRNIGIAFVARAFILVVRVLSVALIARYLGREGFGIYGFVLAFVGVFTALSDLGLNRIVTRELAKDREDRSETVGNAQTLKGMLSVTMLGVIAASIHLVSEDPTVRYCVYLLSAAVVLNLTTNIYFSIFRAFEKMQYEAALIFLDRGTYLLLLFIFIYYDLGIVSVFTAYFIGVLLKQIVGRFWLVPKLFLPRYRCHLERCRELLREALPLGVLIFLGGIYLRVDILILSYLREPAEVGLFTGAYRLLDALSFLPAIVLAPIFPSLARLAQADRERLRLVSEKAFKLLASISVPVGFGLFLLADKVVVLVLGIAFFDAGAALKVLSIALIFNFLNGLHLHLLQALKLQGLYLKWGLLALAVDVLLDFMLIPHYGFMGAAYATLTADLILFASGALLVRRHVCRVSLLRSYLLPAAAGGVMAIAVYLTLSLPLVANVAIGGLVYLGMAYMLRIFDREELLALRRTLETVSPPKPGKEA